MVLLLAQEGLVIHQRTTPSQGSNGGSGSSTTFGGSGGGGGDLVLQVQMVVGQTAVLAGMVRHQALQAHP